MKKNVFTLLVISFLGAYSFPLMAQNEDVQKVKVNVEITKDGKTENIVKEYDVSGDGKVIWEFDDDEKGEGEIIIRKMINSKDELVWVDSNDDFEMSNTAFLGVVGYTINENGGGEKKVRITKVIEGEAAAKAGLKNEDIIEFVDGKTLETYEELVEVIRAKKPGDVVKVKVKREGKSKEMEVTLGQRGLDERRFTKGLEGEENVKVYFERVRATSKEDEEIIQKATGVNSSSAGSFNEVSIELFPNPSDDNFKYKLKIDEGGELERILLDTQGKVIETKTFESKNGVYEGEVNLGDKPAGNYILIFKRGDKILSEKLMKH
ncbi:PDZ domain-containing protein [Owenweeksia hongkongensis]|uniref:PDZ domain-containing protein n=1 Tax=Owenweeksia hongkongensis TaxID=253245 RepID=UPI003A8FDE4A